MVAGLAEFVFPLFDLLCLLLLGRIQCLCVAPLQLYWQNK
jgi:hypothetical protein